MIKNKSLHLFFCLCILFLSSASTASAQQVSKLQWAPPKLTNPQTITLSPTYTKLDLDTAKDYILKMPASKLNGNITLNGGRNIVIIGGHMSVTTSAKSNQEHAFRLSGQTGTIHIEGVLIDGSNGGEEDCFYLDTPNAIIQIENVRCVGIPGSEKTNHSDVIQFHSGHKEARIDRLTGSSYYQGIFIGEHDGKGKFGPIHLRNVNLSSLGDHYKTQLWMASSNHGYLMGYVIDFQNVWLKPMSANPTDTSMLNKLVLPNLSAKSPWTMIVTGNKLTWPGVPDKMKGFVTLGVPNADFVPDGTAGLRYTSPGYVSGGAVPSILPTYVCAGSTSGICPTVGTNPTIPNNPSPTRTATTTIPSTTLAETTPVASPTPKPKDDKATKKEKKRTKSGGFISAFIQFLIQLITYFMSLYKK